MTLGDRLADAVVARSSAILVGLLLATLAFGAGIPAVEDDTSLERYEGDSPEVETLEYADGNFTARDEETTTVQLVVTGENVLSRESMLSTLELQRQIRADESVSSTLADERAIAGVENVLATRLARERKADELADRADELERRAERLNETVDRLETALNETRRLEREYAALNASYERGEITPAEYTFRSQEIESDLADVFDAATADLDENQTARFARATSSARSLEREVVALERAYENGSISESEYERERSRLQRDADAVLADGTVGVLEDDYETLQSDRSDLERERRQLASPAQPPIDDQIAALEALNESEYEAAVAGLLSEDGGPGSDVALRMLPTSYEPGTTSAGARAIVVTQTVGGGESAGPTGLDRDTVDAQLEIRDLADRRPETYAVVGSGIVGDEIDRATSDSLRLVSPLALLFVVVALGIAYRDPLDVALGVAGVLAVLVWTFGVMGWAGITFDLLFVAVPVLLIGLSIDYAIHVFMRHRERRGGDGPADVRGSMRIALAGVGVALVWVTATTAIGFLSNLVSPIAPIREFGLVSAVGIGAALVVFGVGVPAAKVELDEALERRGYDRDRRAFGRGDGRLADVLAVGYVAARRAPLALLLIVGLVTAGGVYGATQVDTSFDQSDFLAEEAPGWTDDVPEAIRPGEYRAKADLAVVDDRFQREGTEAQIVVRGDVTDGETLHRLSRSQETAAESGVTYTLATGDADVKSPITVMESAAAENESFAAAYGLADRTGDGVPDQNLEGLYDRLFEIDPEGASDVIHRADDGSYDGVRLVVGVDGDATSAETTDEMRDVAAAFAGGTGGAGGGGDAVIGGSDDAGAADDSWDVVATGSPIVTHVVETTLFRSVVWSFAVSLVAVFAFLTVAFRVTGSSATLGAVTLLPVVLSVTWILGTMALVGIPFNVLTGTITSLSVGLGVAYSIHVSTRFTLELERQGGLWEPLYATVTGTGGALLGSAATTVGGFGVLAFAVLPTLRQFGIITALTVLYAFLASVLVLPTLLVLWRRYTAPADAHGVGELGIDVPYLEAVTDGTPDATRIVDAVQRAIPSRDEPRERGRRAVDALRDRSRRHVASLRERDPPSLGAVRGRGGEPTSSGGERDEDGDAFSFETIGNRDVDLPSFDASRYRDALSSLEDVGHRVVEAASTGDTGGTADVGAATDADRGEAGDADAAGAEDEAVDDGAATEARCGQILLRGDVTDPDAFAAVAAVEREVGGVDGVAAEPTDAAGSLIRAGRAPAGGSIVDGIGPSNGTGESNDVVDEPADESGAANGVSERDDGSWIRGPIGALSILAGRDETIARALIASDRDGDGLPETDVERLYDLLYEVDDDLADDVLYRTGDGEYAAARVTVPLAAGSSPEAELLAVARGICDERTDASLEAFVSVTDAGTGNEGDGPARI